MPYKDKERVRQYQRDWVRQRRLKGSTSIKLSNPSNPNSNLTPPDVVQPKLNSANLMSIMPVQLRPYSKERQLKVLKTKKQVDKEVTFKELKARFDYRLA